MTAIASAGRLARVFLALAALATVAACAQNKPAATTAGTVAPGTAQDFIVNVGDRVYFLVDQSDLTDQARAILDRQATWLNRYGSYRILIEGHADERGTRDYNIALGDRRAQAVSQYLQSQGIAAARIQTISFGKDKPLDPGHDEAAWARNRNSFSNIIVEAVS